MNKDEIDTYHKFLLKSDAEQIQTSTDLINNIIKDCHRIHDEFVEKGFQIYNYAKEYIISHTSDFKIEIMYDFPYRYENYYHKNELLFTIREGWDLDECNNVIYELFIPHQKGSEK